MSDTLYLSLWYPNLRLEALGEKLCAVLGAFAAHGGEARVYSATVWPVSWSETPVFERVYGRMAGDPGANAGAEPRHAVEEALELLHEDDAYEFQIGWNLWELEAGDGGTPGAGKTTAGSSTAQEAQSAPRSVQDDRPKLVAQDDNSNLSDQRLAGRWVRGTRLVRVTGYGPLFGEGAYEQDGHIRIDLGSDAPFLEEGADLDHVGARYVEENVRQLIALAGGVEKASGATARLLWSELGESLAQRLAERLGIRN